MQKSIVRNTVLWLVIIFGATGCAFGNSKYISSPTVGQELKDLKVALEKGAISQEEYEQAKTVVLTGRKNVEESSN